MSIEQYDENCKGCRPVLLDIKTGEPMPEDSPTMKIVAALWEQATTEEKRAWHDFTCLNSRNPKIISTAMAFAQKIQDAMQKAEADNAS